MRARTACAAAAGAVALAVVLWLAPDTVVRFGEWVKGAGPWGAAALGGFFVVATVLLVPFWLLAIATGFALGGPAGGAVAFVANSLGGVLAFSAARTFARSPVDAMLAGRPRLRAISEAVGTRGFRMVLLTRLSPLLPSNMLNYAFGASAVSFRSFLVGTWLGMLPTLVLYVYLGATARCLSDLAAGRIEMHVAEKAMLGVGLAITVVATVWIALIARRAMRDAVPAA